MKKKIISIAAAVVLSANTAAVFAENAARGEVCQMLLNAADFYNPSVQKEDILKGYEDGELHEERPVTRAEALVMLNRAFGELPKPTDYTKSVMFSEKRFDDIPSWAKSELLPVFNAGLAAGKEENKFFPDDYVTEDEMNLFINRTYTLFSCNEKDDFYSSVNKDILNDLAKDKISIISGMLYNLNNTVNEQVDAIIKEVISSEHEKGSIEQKISDYYKSMTDMYARDRAGIEPIKKYVDLIQNAADITELINARNTIQRELGTALFMDFDLDTDLKDSSKYAVVFDAKRPPFDESFYNGSSDGLKTAYINRSKSVFSLLGFGLEQADNMAERVFELEKLLSGAVMTAESYSDADKTYNVFSMSELREIFPETDSVFDASGFDETDKIIVNDPNYTRTFLSYFTDAKLNDFKAWGIANLMLAYGSLLNHEFSDVSEEFSDKLLGGMSYSVDETNAMLIKNTMPDYMGKLYSERYFSKEAKQDVENMVNDIIGVYREHLKNNTWLSGKTKEKALKKLDTLDIKVGYPDKWQSPVDNAEIVYNENENSCFINEVNINKAIRAEKIKNQNKATDKSKWYLDAFSVNAYYTPTSNDIIFPAAILQPPFYDVNASYEENLGGIGFIIAHEITHAFDNNGAKFDENGNAADWWERRDYEKFQELCDKMTAFYDGLEEAAGIPVNGTLTLSENVADNGAIQCVTEIAASLPNPDFKSLYKSFARCFASVKTREYAGLIASTDYHSPEKLRVNRTVVNCDEFYTAFNIDENDGMYVPPSHRVKIW